MVPIDQSENAILHVENLKKYFPVRKGFFQRVVDWIKAVDGVDFSVAPGQTLGLVGESGCGKSTVARTVLRLIEPDEGRIVYKGRDISDYTENEMKPLRKEMQIIFQDPYGSLNPRMKIGQSIEEGLRTFEVPKTERRDRIEKLLRMVGMSPDSAGRYPHEFSGGQRQRIGIARALSVEPSLIICDEPISALDVSIQAQIINLLKDLQDQLGLSYLFISHDLNVVGYLCSAVSVMYKGRILEHAPSEMLFDRPRHPYTLSLLAAIPDAADDSEHEIKEGRPDSVSSGRRNTPTGEGQGERCSFEPVCERKDDPCRKENTDLIEVEKNHWVRCWKMGEDGSAAF
ncbi:MAG: ATP-binding cassette domain-containing protein [Desulfobacteraceae bacterium]|nr:MAG: ATP-binding cassette domain-containing protein [Desulfobacteraceae bacterium]